jgi:predicted enzyme related to lactoylglutathione lyase
MSDRNGYAPGVPCWVDTWQPDADAAVGFYTALFGWEANGPSGGPYMCTLRGRDVAFVGQLGPEDAHRPSAWMTYVWVDSAERAAERAVAAGGSVPVGPFDALDGGRIAIVADPAGAHFGVWQVGEHSGAEVVNEPGAWSWSQLLTSDPDGAKPFYGAVFGWETGSFGDITMWRVPGYVGGEPAQPVARDVVAGMAPLPEGGGRPQWRIDFWVDDVDATVAKATTMGGRAIIPPYDAGIARQAVIADPAGAAFSVSRITAGD